MIPATTTGATNDAINIALAAVHPTVAQRTGEGGSTVMATVDVFRRGEFLLVTSEVLARDYVWFTIPDFQVLPVSTSSDELGALIHRRLCRAMALDPETGTPTAERKKIYAAHCKAVGAKGMRDFARNNDAVNFTWNDERGLMVTPQVALDNGGFGAWGGDVTIGPIPAPDELGRLCREGWERGGAPQPEGSEPSHT